MGAPDYPFRTRTPCIAPGDAEHRPARRAAEPGPSNQRIHGLPAERRDALRRVPNMRMKSGAPKSESARGGRALSVVDLGLGSSTYPRGDFGGAGKEPREFKKLVSPSEPPRCSTR